MRPIYERLIPEAKKEIMQWLAKGESPKNLMTPPQLGESKGESPTSPTPKTKGQDQNPTTPKDPTVGATPSGRPQTTQPETNPKNQDTPPSPSENKPSTTTKPTKPPTPPDQTPDLKNQANQFEPKDPTLWKIRQEQIAQAQVKNEGKNPQDPAETQPDKDAEPLTPEELKNIQISKQTITKAAIEGNLYLKI